MKVAVLGSTGLVGKNVLKLLARLPQVVRVFCPVRSIPDLKDLGILEGAFKIDFKQVDFEQDNDAMRLFFYAGFTGCDAVVCCLGTTRKQAGGKAAQEKIDLRLPLKLAAIAKKAGVKWLPSEFKKRYGENRSLALCEQYNVYRQLYCGCEYSLKKREEHAT